MSLVAECCPSVRQVRGSVQKILAFEGQGMFLKETLVPEQEQSSGSGLFGLRENISPQNLP